VPLWDWTRRWRGLLSQLHCLSSFWALLEPDWLPPPALGRERPVPDDQRVPTTSHACSGSGMRRRVVMEGGPGWQWGWRSGPGVLLNPCGLLQGLHALCVCA
jgi:hypothetical protein